MGRIFIFSEFYYPNELSSGYYVTEIAEHLAKKCEVTVVCISNVKRNVCEARNNVNIIRIPDSEWDKNSLLSRSIRFIKIVFQFVRIAKLSIKAEDHVVCVTNPAFSLLAFSRLKKKIKFSLTVFVHDLFPENLVGTGILSSHNILYGILLWLYNNAYNKVDYIVTCGRDMKALFELKLKSFKGEIENIPNWGDSESIATEFGENVRRKFNLEGRMIFQFAGNIGRAQGIPLILDSAKKVYDPNISFLFFGNGVLEEKVKAHAKKSNNVTYGGTFSRNELGQYLNAADIAIVSLAKGMKGLGVPSKTFNIMAAGKPILYIGERDSEIAIIIEEEEIGYIVEPGSVNSLLNGINYFRFLDNEEIRKMGERSRSALVEKYSKIIILKRYSELFEKITG